MHWFKVYFLKQTPVLVEARDDIEAATLTSKKFGYNLSLFVYAIRVDKIIIDVWDEVA